MEKEMMNNEYVRRFAEACSELMNSPEGESLLSSLLTPMGMSVCRMAADRAEKPAYAGDSTPKNWSDSEIDDVIARTRRGERVEL